MKTWTISVAVIGLAGLCASFAVTSLGLAGTPLAPKRVIRYSDVPVHFRGWLDQHAASESNFAGYIRSINEATARREQIGEYDHLIYFLLQSKSFTHKPPVEPALSAQEFVQRLSSEERSRYLKDESSYAPPMAKLPKSASLRFDDFIQALNKRHSDDRLAYFRALIQKTTTPLEKIYPRLYSEYARSMKFLYRKEFTAKEIRDPQQRADYVASLYRDRGHSTDTQIESSFAIYTGLATIKALAPSSQLNRILIVGPGLDFAPRTDLIDVIGPQSYQPFAIADVLIGLKLSDPNLLRIHCVDINERVLAYLEGFPKRKIKQLTILSGMADKKEHRLSDDYKDYFRELGNNIGITKPILQAAKFDFHLKKSLLVRDEIAERIRADKLNIITERYDPSPCYDLIVITNVFPYFNETEVLLALCNMQSMLKEDGYLIHNELRAIISSFADGLHLPIIHSRSVLIASANQRSLFDAIVIHRKSQRR